MCWWQRIKYKNGNAHALRTHAIYLTSCRSCCTFMVKEQLMRLSKVEFPTALLHFDVASYRVIVRCGETAWSRYTIWKDILQV